ncbi:hypothetical protein H7F15_19285 [Pontibacter sp. Tf4]|uniref:hypothetical protein n=1 Tax=Pontibacter sp. Tf4 TaxID=2761620 RepID=UPI00162AD892|nr:hypothetical protein [Pontibacter sp. Tf4]MBB6613187.1 hypothetical protein [Pontibacter sp. Tf4]
MKKILFLLCVFLLSQCKQKASESKLNDSNFTEGEVIHYQYDESGRLVKERKVSYLLVGNKPDSLSFVTTYFYDKKGRKIKVEDHDGSDELLSTTFFNYDSRDSLLAEYIVDTHGDTTTLVENAYGENGNLHLNKHRQLLNTQSEDDLLNGKSNYDTLFTLTENFYQSGLLIRSTDRDVNNALVVESEYKYDGQKLVKMEVYEFQDSKKQLRIANFYPNIDKASGLERITVNILGDTIGVRRIEKHESGKVARSIELDTELGHAIITRHNLQGHIIEETFIIKDLGRKTIRRFSFDSSGRKIKEVSNDLPLTEEENKLL